MFSDLPITVQAELDHLAQRYGQPLIRTVVLPSAKRFDPLSKTDRYGEVCMVIRRPNGHLLTMTKTYYPRQAYRLLTGGINHGETVLDALLRETQEETGLEVIVRHFLVAVAYQLPGESTPAFYTFAFLLDEIGGTLGAIDDGEEVEDFREITLEELPALAQRLHITQADNSDMIAGNWGDWGHFRAVIHELVWKALRA